MSNINDLVTYICNHCGSDIPPGTSLRGATPGERFCTEKHRTLYAATRYGKS